MTIQERDDKYLSSAHALLTAKRDLAELDSSLSEKAQNILDEVIDEWISQVEKNKGVRS